MKWIKYEYFYSWVDKGYFLENPLRDILSNKQVKMAKEEWSRLRKAFSDVMLEI